MKRRREGRRQVCSSSRCSAAVQLLHRLKTMRLEQRQHTLVTEMSRAAEVVLRRPRPAFQENPDDFDVPVLHSRRQLSLARIRNAGSMVQEERHNSDLPGSARVRQCPPSSGCARIAKSCAHCKASGACSTSQNAFPSGDVKKVDICA
jgi:hypothetical protein